MSMEEVSGASPDKRQAGEAVEDQPEAKKARIESPNTAPSSAELESESPTKDFVQESAKESVGGAGENGAKTGSEAGAQDGAAKKVTGVDLGEVKRQLEYYFSDENLQYDRFFQTTIRADADNWLSMQHILSCRKIQKLGVTQSDILEALKNSPLETVVREDGTAAVRRTTPLPELKERPPRADRHGDGKGREGRGDRKGNQNQKNNGDDLHGAGCIIAIKNIPAEATWEQIKLKLTERIPDTEIAQTAEEKAEGKKVVIARSIQFISTPDPKGECYALMAVFPGDREYFENMEPLEVNGAKLEISLCNDVKGLDGFLNGLPSLIKRRRQKIIMEKRKAINSRPVLVGGSRFESIEAMRRCLREVLNTLSVGTTVNDKTKQCLLDLLAYHPSGKAKFGDVVNFKADMVAKGDKPTKCFFFVRADGTCDDFSLNKCFVALSQNPPFADTTPTPTPTATAAPEAASTEEAKDGEQKGAKEDVKEGAAEEPAVAATEPSAEAAAAEAAVVTAAEGTAVSE